jgi:hypothetical protein
VIQTRKPREENEMYYAERNFSRSASEVATLGFFTKTSRDRWVAKHTAERNLPGVRAITADQARRNMRYERTVFAECGRYHAHAG